MHADKIVFVQKKKKNIQTLIIYKENGWKLLLSTC